MGGDSAHWNQAAFRQRNQELMAKKKPTHKSPNKGKSSVIPYSLFTDFDIDLFKSGKHNRLYQKFGAHVKILSKQLGVYFAVWAPNAKGVSVIGNFNDWNRHEHQLYVRWDGSGIWEGFIPKLGPGEIYKYKIISNSGQELEKSDPFAFFAEVPPKTASIVWNSKHKWEDKEWMQNRKNINSIHSPFTVYEVHLGSWKRKLKENNRSLSYVELSSELVRYVKKMGFTHVEFLPVMHHPFFGSWGYQITGYFAPSSMYGNPSELKFLIDQFHLAGIGILLDWVPSHFPGDEHGLYQFDGTSLYEHEDPRRGYHPDWSSYIFNYGRNEIKSFLISNALYWLDQYHVDGLRVDAVASMLYLDYSRNEGEWLPNKFGGKENLEAISFLKEFNETAYQNYPDIQTIAEESTAWPMVTRPTYLGGLGFGMKWMMGWMNDTLEYFKKDPIHRQFHQNEITFSLTYAFTENFMLPLSHDEVVHGKGPIIDRMQGDEWRRFANLRLLYAYMYTHPGNKLLFMGNEIGQTYEWQHDHSLPWELLKYPPHKGLQLLIADLNKLYKKQKALYEKSFSPEGFQWIDFYDNQNSIIIYLRTGIKEKDRLLVICNFTPNEQRRYRVGIDKSSKWREIFNSDQTKYWGSGFINKNEIKVQKKGYHGRENSLVIKVPPLGVSILKSHR